MAMAPSAAGEKRLPALLLFRVREIDFHAALRERYRVLDFFTSGKSLPAFLSAAAAADGDPPRAAVTVGGAAARVDAAFLDAVPSLRFVFSTGAGTDHIDLAECARRGVAVANSGTVYSVDVADHAVGLLLDVLRRVSAAGRDYPLGIIGTKVGGKRVGIIGLGNIGMLIAKRLHALGCAIAYTSRKPKESVSSYRFFPSVGELASESDVLVVACLLSDETRHAVNRDVLDALGKGGVVVNIGRGRAGRGAQGREDRRSRARRVREGAQGAPGALRHGQRRAHAPRRRSPGRSSVTSPSRTSMPSSPAGRC